MGERYPSKLCFADKYEKRGESYEGRKRKVKSSFAGKSLYGRASIQ